MKAIVHGSGLAVALCMLGCAQPAPSTRTFSHLALPGVSRDDAYAAARRTMAERFRIAESDADQGLLRSAPVESAESGSKYRVGDLVGVPRRMRTVATTIVTGNENSADVWCKVIVQRYETSAARLFSNEMSIDDAPIGTAAERDASTTPEQNAVWKMDRRDRDAESSLLRTVQERIGGNAPGSPTATPADSSLTPL